MTFGTYTGPDKADKGKEGGSCNRASCQAPDALWYHHGSYSWYCADCREDIQFDKFNLQDWQLTYEPRLGHPMFETREMIDARAAIVQACPLRRHVKGTPNLVFSGYACNATGGHCQPSTYCDERRMLMRKREELEAQLELDPLSI